MANGIIFFNMSPQETYFISRQPVELSRSITSVAPFRHHEIFDLNLEHEGKNRAQHKGRYRVIELYDGGMRAFARCVCKGCTSTVNLVARFSE